LISFDPDTDPDADFKDLELQILNPGS